MRRIPERFFRQRLYNICLYNTYRNRGYGYYDKYFNYLFLRTILERHRMCCEYNNRNHLSERTILEWHRMCEFNNEHWQLRYRYYPILLSGTIRLQLGSHVL